MAQPNQRILSASSPDAAIFPVRYLAALDLKAAYEPILPFDAAYPQILFLTMEG